MEIFVKFCFLILLQYIDVSLSRPYYRSERPSCLSLRRSERFPASLVRSGAPKSIEPSSSPHPLRTSRWKIILRKGLSWQKTCCEVIFDCNGQVMMRGYPDNTWRYGRWWIERFGVAWNIVAPLHCGKARKNNEDIGTLYNFAAEVCGVLVR